MLGGRLTHKTSEARLRQQLDKQALHRPAEPNRMREPELERRAQAGSSHCSALRLCSGAASGVSRAHVPSTGAGWGPAAWGPAPGLAGGSRLTQAHSLLQAEKCAGLRQQSPGPRACAVPSPRPEKAVTASGNAVRVLLLGSDGNGSGRRLGQSRPDPLDVSMTH